MLCITFASSDVCVCVCVCVFVCVCDLQLRQSLQYPDNTQLPHPDLRDANGRLHCTDPAKVGLHTMCVVAGVLAMMQRTDGMHATATHRPACTRPNALHDQVLRTTT